MALPGHLRSLIFRVPKGWGCCSGMRSPARSLPRLTPQVTRWQLCSSHPRVGFHESGSNELLGFPARCIAPGAVRGTLWTQLPESS